MSEPKFIIGLDVGQKRIGVARGNNTARLASPLTTINVDGNELENLKQIIHENDVKTVVIGLPRSLNGNETSQTKSVREFAKTLPGNHYHIIFQDEAATTVQAEAEQQMGASKTQIDAHAATIILQDYLDGLR